MNNKETAQKILKAHPGIEKVFTTSDGQVFFTENHASNHARSLKDKDVEPVSKVEDKALEQVLRDGGDAGDGVAKEAAAKAAEEAAAKAAKEAAAKAATELTPAQKAAITKAANKAKAAAGQ